MNIKIRYTVESDISTLAQVHSRSLQAAFGELFPIEIVNVSASVMKGVLVALQKRLKRVSLSMRWYMLMKIL